MAHEKDFIDEIVQERTRINAEFPTRVDAAGRARQTAEGSRRAPAAARR